MSSSEMMTEGARRSRADCQLLLRELGDGVRQRRDAQRDEHLVGVQARVVVAETLDLELLDRLDDLRGNEVELVAHTAPAP